MRKLIIKLIRERKLMIYKDIDSYPDVLSKFLDEVFPEDDSLWSTKSSAVQNNRYFFADTEYNAYAWAAGNEREDLPIITLSEILELPGKYDRIISKEQWNSLMKIMDDTNNYDASKIRVEFRNLFEVETDKTVVIDQIKSLMALHNIDSEELKL